MDPGRRQTRRAKPRAACTWRESRWRFLSDDQSNAGKVGEVRLELAKNLRAIRTHWRHVGETLAQIGRDMRDAQLAIQAADLELESAEIGIAIQRINSWAAAAEMAAKAAGSSIGLDLVRKPG